ncbi:4-hydroxy-2-oxoheptanedioate aldolase [Deinococcus metalli]|uniref:2,4-dihydroxyhept-2-ene-1,7-dioic acid aldolase n=1 Tax=Deinococcus metalli TaxID=1141878 RepID=A0A7W8NP37_9DEIO|nr:aldolase/citrate lyase family protein [Deinococcus metalli]MBB5376401.1 4-hydroxy-2-oxoheptanedioate aldolase [Deinococcus metalli]GHF44343.1 2,4-dihydroxyhept-2-ene-1,7-dioic acid aldolase [Deinococcus metalli]
MRDVLESLYARLSRSEMVLNGWLHLPGGVSAEVMGRAGYDALTIDLQHGLIGDGGLVPTLQAIAGTPAAPVVRVPGLHAPDLMRALDAGAVGVICPMIDTPEQAAALVQACRYAPHGTRSFGPTRARLVHGDDYAARADTQTLVFAMIETARALTNLDAILATPGLSGVYVGPGDLSLSMTGRATLDFRGGEVEVAVAHIARSAAERGLIPGIFTQGGDLARAAMALGYRFVTAGSDLALLAGAARGVLDDLRAASPAPSTALY